MIYKLTFVDRIETSWKINSFGQSPGIANWKIFKFIATAKTRIFFQIVQKWAVIGLHNFLLLSILYTVNCK